MTVTSVNHSGLKKFFENTATNYILFKKTGILDDGWAAIKVVCKTKTCESAQYLYGDN